MAFINSPDILMSLIPETTFGVTPTTGATRYELPVTADQAPIAYSTADVASDTKRPNRASAGTRRGMGSASGSLDMRLSKAPVFGPLIASALSGTFVTGVAKGSTVDSTFSLLALLRQGTATNALLQVTRGCIVTSFGLSLKANEGVGASFDILGAARDNLTTDNAISVTSVPNAVVEYVGKEVASISVAGTTLSYVSAEFSTGQDRANRAVLGSDVGVGYATTGTRQTTLTVKAYRESFAVESAISGAPQAVSITIGSVGDGWRIDLPAAIGQVPVDEVDNGSVLVSITFTAAYDTVSGTDVIVTQL